MPHQDVFDQAREDARRNAADDSIDDRPGGIWSTAPIGAVDKNYVDFWLNRKQNTLVSGENIRTVNGQSLLGAGNIAVAGGGAASPGSMVSNEVPGGAKDGDNIVFTTANPFETGSTRLYINGLRQQLGAHYYESGNQQINIPDSVQSSDILIVDYISS